MPAVISSRRTPERMLIEESSAFAWSMLGPCGGFRFSSSSPESLLATCYGTLLLEHLGETASISNSTKDSITAYICKHMEDDGSFTDPLATPENTLSDSHSVYYLKEEVNTFCQQALHAWGVPAPPRIFIADRQTASGTIDYFNSLRWDNPWLDSNYVMFHLSQLCHDIEVHNRSEYIETVDAALDWLDEHQDPLTGLWVGKTNTTLQNAMAAWFHFSFFYQYRNRPMRFRREIVNSCMKLQTRNGLFNSKTSGANIGQTCLDYDAIDLATLCSPQPLRQLKRASQALLQLRNDDGGFADAKYASTKLNLRPRKVFSRLPNSIDAKLWRRIPASGTYHVCTAYLSCNTTHSNLFSTWFRLLALNLSSHAKVSGMNCKFRALPFLGYRKGW